MSNLISHAIALFDSKYSINELYGICNSQRREVNGSYEAIRPTSVQSSRLAMLAQESVAQEEPVGTHSTNTTQDNVQKGREMRVLTVISLRLFSQPGLINRLFSLIHF